VKGGRRPDVERCADDPLPGGELQRGEEPRAAVAHRHQRRAVDRRLELETKQVRVTLPKESRNRDVVMDNRARPGQTGVERHHGVEQPVDRAPARLEVDPEIAREQQIGLPRLHCDACGDAVLIEIPRTRTHVVLGDDPAARE